MLLQLFDTQKQLQSENFGQRFSSQLSKLQHELDQARSDIMTLARSKEALENDLQDARETIHELEMERQKWKQHSLSVEMETESLQVI